ncbi:RnfABCDGE type electron transport complex subunit D [Candidatus Poribacteria bacterium]|nr:RnfABCDGE type electron transport complex subunit D [Candidatus Poribacteria bacterium]
MNEVTLTVSSPPHWHTGQKISRITYGLMIALIPAVILGIVNYKMHAVSVLSVAIVSAMAAEAIMQYAMKRPLSLTDGSAALSGLLLALMLPASAPWWLVVVGSMVGIVVGKQIFGGLGGYPFNPVLIGWAIIRISWPGHLNLDDVLVNFNLGNIPMADPLTTLKTSGTAGLNIFSYGNLLIGKQLGGIGATASLWLLIGGLFAIIRGYIPWRIPASFILGILLASSLYWFANKTASPLFHILTGNVMLGAFFLATESTTSPVNNWAMVLFGVGCGILTMLIRIYGIYPDGVVFAILLMNMVNPLLDKIRPRVIGKVSP